MAINMKKEDRDALEAAGARWNAATTQAEKDAAHRDAESIRAKYNYSGGADGSQRIALGSGGSGTNPYQPATTGEKTWRDYVGMSQADRADLDKWGNAWNSATNQSQKDYAHQMAEKIRQKYGYSGGTDGSQFKAATQRPQSNFSYERPSSSQGNGGGFTYDKAPVGDFSSQKAPTFQDQYSQRIDALLDKIANREPFSYNAENDPIYQQYKEQYNRAGKNAMEDTLGQVSARTGGLASSYAVSAAQQANQYYAQQLADKVPALYQAAYDMYLNEANQQVRDLGLLQNASDAAYNRYRDSVNDWQNNRYFDYGVYRDSVNDWRNDRNFDYGVYRDQMNDWQNDRNFAYGVNRDQISDSRYQDETAWNRNQYNSETEYNRAIQKAQTLAAAGDFSGYKALGYTDEDVANLKAAYDREQSLKAYLARKSSGGSTPTTGTEFAEDGIVEGDYDALFQRASQSYDPENFISTFKDKFGFKYSTGLYDAYLRWVENGGASTNVSFDYDPDEGVFALNGQQYTATGDLEAAIKDLGLTKGQLDVLMKKVDANTVYKGWSQNGRNLLNQMQKIPGLTDENKVAMINDAFEKGRISEYDVDLILKHLGYGG